MALSPSAAAIEVNNDITPADMARAGVPFHLAFWHHMVRPRLRRYSDWDVERIMAVRLQVAQCGA